MKQVRFLGCGTLRFALLLLLGWSAYLPTPVLATDLPPIGGLKPGGEYSRSECPKGSYLVGLKGNSGAWVDHIAAVCAPWLLDQQTFGRTSVRPRIGTSGGGKELSPGCWGSGVRNRAVQSLRLNFEYVKTEGKLLLSLIQAHCTSLSPSGDTGLLVFGTQYPKYQYMQGPYEGPPPNQACPAGEIAVGIHGHGGPFVYFIGLICGPPPSLGPLATKVNPLAMKLETPATKVNPLATAPERAATNVNPLVKAPVPTDDMFTIIRPVWNDQVQQGHLVLAAQPPKAGMTQVTQLEFTWLDAPPNQPYVNNFAVDTNSLLQGYPVPQQITRGNSGRWKVRARASGKAIPGPWSFPVEFQLFLTQPTQSQQPAPPLVQQAPMPSSSVTQQPSSGATTQMKRSGSMIMPRGIEKEAGKEGNQTVDEPAKTEKRP